MTGLSSMDPEEFCDGTQEIKGKTLHDTGILLYKILKIYRTIIL